MDESDSILDDSEMHDLTTDQNLPKHGRATRDSLSKREETKTSNVVEYNQAQALRSKETNTTKIVILILVIALAALFILLCYCMLVLIE